MHLNAAPTRPATIVLDILSTVKPGASEIKFSRGLMYERHLAASY